jgi:hypothetical protein
MPSGEIMAVYAKNSTWVIDTLCGQNAELLIVKAGVTRRLMFKEGKRGLQNYCDPFVDVATCVNASEENTALHLNLQNEPVFISLCLKSIVSILTTGNQKSSLDLSDEVNKFFMRRDKNYFSVFLLQVVFELEPLLVTPLDLEGARIALRKTKLICVTSMSVVAV